ncbi:RNA methyltransferase [Rossellomorea vietnamensis]|uniref:RNA methyltransferase n=2 Tax=Rossellomorea TaxID=2837508 RepID=A0A5D4KJ39_9BACI|nr:MULTISPECIES: RNA methyltransferase [Rossellomorea]TYR76899.1 RNA methyltransferase [Rossellomorea vietnamensis]TYS84114.1 RNA methyltransferase [Rossellomorea aquimaris]
MKYVQSAKNPQVKQWKKLHTKKERDRSGTYMVEGFHLVEEALKYNEVVQEVLVKEGIDLPSAWNLDSVSVTQLSEDAAKAVSATETSQGVFAVCYQPETQEGELKGRTFLMLDEVQDPGNLGTIIRTADAAGIDMIILGEGTADLYNPKVLRSAQGSHFHLPIVKGELPDWIERLKNEGVPVYGTALENSVEYHKVSSEESFALILGNEGNGVSPSILGSTDQNLYVPIYGKSESLNVAIAAGILMYHLKKAQ